MLEEIIIKDKKGKIIKKEIFEYNPETGERKRVK